MTSFNHRFNHREEINIFVCLQKLNIFLKSTNNESTGLMKILERIDAHLKEVGSKFMVSDTLCRADCLLLPTIQHLRVAGKVSALYV